MQVKALDVQSRWPEFIPLDHRKRGWETTHQGAFWSQHAQCGTVAHAHPYSHTMHTQLRNNYKQTWYEEASLVLWNTEPCKEILDVTWEKRHTHKYIALIMNANRTSLYQETWHTWSGWSSHHSRLSWLIASPRSQQWRKRQLHWIGPHYTVWGSNSTLRSNSVEQSRVSAWPWRWGNVQWWK